eukprot:m.86598 g.86598  ORF g.86598 m.86598 type:complete len:1003 (-) comp9671_c0_seq2:75-3083(-)
MGLPWENCVATTAFNATLMNVNLADVAMSETYECEGDICWERHPTPNTGDVAWMLFATTFVMLQTPATGFAQGGLVRRKNTLSVIGQSVAGVVIGSLLWYVVGYSLTFGSTRRGFIGSPLTHLFFKDVSAFDCLPGQTIPHLLYASFQMTFALMVPVLVTGAWAEKFHFFSACLFMFVWPILVYYPMAHAVWGGGWLQVNPVDDTDLRALDYAGGITIHVSSGVSSLVVAMMLQKRHAFKRGSTDFTSNLPITMVGITLVWVGWYSFNGGSGLRANGQAVSALFVTQISASTSALVWAVCSYLDDGFIQVTHIGSGALAGLAGITAGSGYVNSNVAGVPYGLVVGLASFYGGKVIKYKLQLDDVLDVTSLQAIPGAVGSIMVGLFADASVVPCALPSFPGKACDSNGVNGLFYGGGGKLLGWQIAAVLTQCVWSAFFTWVTLKLIAVFMRRVCGRRLDVPAEMEDIGLDRAEHGEKAYDLEFGDEDEETVLAAKVCSAAAYGNLAEVTRLVRLGANPGGKDIDGRTPLHLAARHGNIPVMKYLVDQCGAQMDATDDYGLTPMKDAKRAGQVEAVEWLQRNAVEDMADDDDVCRLLVAASHGFVGKIRAHIAAGDDINVTDYDGRSALHLAAAEGHVAVVAELLEAGADKSLVDRFGGTPLEDAKRYGYREVVDLLEGRLSSAEASASDNDDLPRCHTPDRPATPEFDPGASNRELLMAAECGDVVELQRLRRKGAHLDGADYDGRTALHLAAKNGHTDFLKTLVAYLDNVNVNAQDRFHETPYTEAMSSGHHEAAEYLRSLGGVEVDSKGVGGELCRLAFAGDLDGLKRAYYAGKCLNSADYDGRTAAHLAAAGGHTHVIEFLAKPGGKGEAANLNAKDRYGGTPLEDAERCGKTAAIRTLLSLGAMDIVHRRRRRSVDGSTNRDETSSPVMQRGRLVRRKNATKLQRPVPLRSRSPSRVGAEPGLGSLLLPHQVQQALGNGYEGDSTTAYDDDVHLVLIND